MLQLEIITDYAQKLVRHPRLRADRRFRDWATENAALSVFLPDEATDPAGRQTIMVHFAEAARTHFADLGFDGDSRSLRQKHATARDRHEIAYAVFKAALLETTGIAPKDATYLPRTLRPAHRIASFNRKT